MNMFTASWLPQGRKEGKERAEAVYKRRMSALSLSHDLDTEFQDALLEYQVDEPDYSREDQLKLLKGYDRARAALDVVYADVKIINNSPIPEKLTPEEAMAIAAPAERILRQADAVRGALKDAKQQKDSLDKPKGIAGDTLKTMERKVASGRATVDDGRRMTNALQVGGAANMPEAQAALQSAERQVTAAEAVLNGARTALMRKKFTDVIDLSERLTTMLSEADSCVDRIKLAHQDFSYASSQAEGVVAAALNRLNEVKAQIESQAALLTRATNEYVMSSVQRLGAARRALRLEPPHYMEALHLAEDARAMADDALQNANTDAQKLRDRRADAHAAQNSLTEKTRDLGTRLKKAQTVPRKATAYYEQARAERDRLSQIPIDSMMFDELDRALSSLNHAIGLVDQALALMD